MQLVVFFGTLLSTFLQFWNSPIFQYVTNTANYAYSKGEHYSRDFLINRLAINDFIRKNGWTILLESMTSRIKRTT